MSAELKKRAVFLDRDGVINRALVREGKPYPPANFEEVEILPGVEAALTRLHDAGFLLLVVTNQPDVARGTTPRADVDRINNFLSSKLPLDKFFVCFHDSVDHCDCRKPLPGLLFAAQKEYDIDLASSYMVGDRWRDIDAGAAAGCKTFFIDYGYAEKQPANQDFTVRSLSEVAEKVLSPRTK